MVRSNRTYCSLISGARDLQIALVNKSIFPNANTPVELKHSCMLLKLLRVVIHHRFNLIHVYSKI